MHRPRGKFAARGARFVLWSLGLPEAGARAALVVLRVQAPVLLPVPNEAARSSSGSTLVGMEEGLHDVC